MSSGQLRAPTCPELFRWQPTLPESEYVFVTYQVVVNGDPAAAALGMAMEQSAATVSLPGYLAPEQLAEWTIRVKSVTPCADIAATAIRPYRLPTDVYPAPGPQGGWHYELAVPRRLLGLSYSQLLNVLIGEIPRLGFVTAFKLLAIRGLEGFGPGPGWGIPAIRERWGVAHGPLLCRSMRPAVGLDTATMARLNYDVLVGGFHGVKDDELMFFASNEQFERHVGAMVAACDAARVQTGEQKTYLANLICDPQDLEVRWEICVRLGVDGVLVAPFIQSIGLMAQLATRRQLPILAHNTCGELVSRNPHWGVDEAVWNQLLRRAGADYLVTSGGYGNVYPPIKAEQHALEAMRCELPGIAASMPILQGGKRPDEILTYRACCGSDDYLLIVASWIDAHPDGPGAGARVFRQAVDAGL